MKHKFIIYLLITESNKIIGACIKYLKELFLLKHINQKNIIQKLKKSEIFITIDALRLEVENLCFSLRPYYIQHCRKFELRNLLQAKASLDKINYCYNFEN